MKRVLTQPLAEPAKITVHPQESLPPRERRPMSRRGNPNYEPNDAVREIVKEMRAAGFTAKRIAALIINPRTGRPIDTSLLNKYYKHEMDTGLDEANWRMSRSIFQQGLGFEGIPNPNFEKPDKRKMIDGVKNPNYLKFDKRKWLVPPIPANTSAAIWWEKTRAGMREGIALEHSGKIEGGANIVNQTVIILPPNGRETGATPTLDAHEWQEVEDARDAPAKKANGSRRP